MPSLQNGIRSRYPSLICPGRILRHIPSALGRPRNKATCRDLPLALWQRRLRRTSQSLSAIQFPTWKQTELYPPGLPLGPAMLAESNTLPPPLSRLVLVKLHLQGIAWPNLPVSCEQANSVAWQWHTSLRSRRAHLPPLWKQMTEPLPQLHAESHDMPPCRNNNGFLDVSNPDRY